MSFKFRLFLISVFILAYGYKTYGYSFVWVRFISIGPIIITESVLAFLLLFIYALINIYKIKWNNALLIPFILLIFFMIIQAFRFSLYSNLNTGGGVSNRLALFLSMFFIFPLAYQFNSFSQIKNFVKIIIFFGIIGALLIVLQFLFPGLSTSIKEGEFIRFGSMGNNLVVFNIVYFYSFLILNKKNTKQKYIYRILLIFSMISLLLTLSRGLILGTILALFMINYYYNKRFHIKNKFLKPLLYGFIISIAMGTYLNFSEDSLLNKFIDRMNLGFEELINKEEHGSVGARVKMISIKFGVNMQENPLFGRGFDYYRGIDISSVSKKYYTEFYFNPYALTGDSTWPNVMLIYGLFGIAIYLIIFYLIYSKAKHLFYSAQNKEFQQYGLMLLSLSFFIFVHSFGASYIQPQNSIFLTFIVIILYHSNIYMKKSPFDNKINDY